MSVHKTIRNGQPRWIVRWRENSQQRSRTFTARKDAREYDAVLGRLRAQGELADELQRRRVTLADAVAHWWDTHAHASRICFCMRSGSAPAAAAEPGALLPRGQDGLATVVSAC